MILPTKPSGFRGAPDGKTKNPPAFPQGFVSAFRLITDAVNLHPLRQIYYGLMRLLIIALGYRLGKHYLVVATKISAKHGLGI